MPASGSQPRGLLKPQWTGSMSHAGPTVVWGLLSRDLKQSIVETAALIWNTVTVLLLCISNVSY